MYTKAAAWASSAHLPTYETRSGFQDGPETNMKQMWCLFYVISLKEINNGSELLYSRVTLAEMRQLIGDAVIRPFSNPRHSIKSPLRGLHGEIPGEIPRPEAPA
jgi:hypothetical protein